MKDGKLIINIGRQFGSGGKQVAMVLGEKLGIKVYDNELISEASEKSGFSKTILQKNDENKSLFSMSGFFASTRYGIVDNYNGDNEIFKIQSSVIREIAEKEESAIFVGRCADYILRDLDCIDVFITAPLEARAKRVSERAGVSVEQAESICKKKDKHRETYYNYFTYTDWGVASNYDICIDSSVLGIEGTADMIINFAKLKEKI